MAERRIFQIVVEPGDYWYKDRPVAANDIRDQIEGENCSVECERESIKVLDIQELSI